MLRKISDDTENLELAAPASASLKRLENFLLQELEHKQRTLDKKDAEISVLQKQLIESQQQLQLAQQRQAECQRSIEGNRQLINKLLTEQTLLQQSLTWYKRTYESRTLMGIIKDRLKFYFSK